MDVIDLLRQRSAVEPVDADVVDRAAADALQAWSERRDEPRPASRQLLRRRPRVVIGAGAVILAAAAGTGIAAASGWWNNPTFQLPAEEAFNRAADPSILPGTQLAITTPGPEGTTFKIFDAAFSYSGFSESCYALRAFGPNGQPLASMRSGSECMEQVLNPTGPLPDPTAVPHGWSWSESVWNAPSGAEYYLGSGTASPGATTVSLVDRAGTILASQAAEPGGYVIYLPADRMQPTLELRFTNSAGRTLFTQEIQQAGTATQPPPD